MIKNCMLTAMMLLYGCQQRIETHGNFLTQDDIARVHVNKSTKSDVLRILGQPSVTIPEIAKDTLIYVGTQTDATFKMAPRLIERSVYVMRFNEQDVLCKIEKRAQQL